MSEAGARGSRFAVVTNRYERLLHLARDVREGAVPTDPKDCRRNALYCEELAKSTSNPERARVFKNLAKQWLKLALEMERAQAFLERAQRPKHN
jgi:hypothetical protein